MKHHAFCNEDEATEALCDFRDHGNALETELTAEREKVRVLETELETEKTNRNHLIEKGAKLETELTRLRAEVERLTKRIADDNKAYGCELRDPNGTIWEQAAKDHARAARAEAALTEAIDGVIDGGSIPDTLLVVHVPRSPVGYRVGQPVKVILPALSTD